MVKPPEGEGQNKIERIEILSPAQSAIRRHRSKNSFEKAIMELLPFQEKDFYNILKTMNGLPVTIRLLDPPLHEFLPNDQKQITALAKNLNIKPSLINERIAILHESNPMLGHRGCRLGITFPELTISSI